MEEISQPIGIKKYELSKYKILHKAVSRKRFTVFYCLNVQVKFE